jgi:hypothetical protein
MSSDGVRDVVARSLELATGRVADLAEEAGAAPATWYAWIAGRNKPSRRGLLRLSHALRQRAAGLLRCAYELTGEAYQRSLEQNGRDRHLLRAQLQQDLAVVEAAVQLLADSSARLAGRSEDEIAVDATRARMAKLAEAEAATESSIERIPPKKRA